jgi:predicted GNAT superfamily acetyltransferase
VSGTEVQSLHTPIQMKDVVSLVNAVWQTDRDLLGPELLIALAHSGNYIAGVYDGDVLIGASIGFFHAPAHHSLHSHIAAVLPDRAGAGVGNALKQHQREWARERGTTQITWTYDPLVARNAYFNLHKLGCEVSNYLSDFYGSMDDGLNQGQPSDRLLVTSFLDRAVSRETNDGPVVLRNDDGKPSPATVTGRHCRVQIPSDIDTIRRESPDLARQWRMALREVLAGLLEDGWTVTDFDRESHYHLRRS